MMGERRRIKKKHEGSICIVLKCVWLSQYNVPEKQLLSTEGMEIQENWEMMTSLKHLSHTQSCSN